MCHDGMTKATAAATVECFLRIAKDVLIGSQDTIGTIKALSIAESGAEAIFPSFFTVATEDNRLARRLYMCSEAKPTNPHVPDSMECVHSYNGQEPGRNGP